MKKKILRTIAITLLCTVFFSMVSTTVLATTTAEMPSAIETTPTGIPLDEIESVIDDFMAERIGVSSPGAAVAIVKNGEIIFTGAYGMADIENNIPVSVDTVFEYGSISKMFVWVSVMQLVEQGVLDLDVDIRTYLPDEFNQKWDITYPVTLRNILNHSAGFGEYPFELLLPDEYTDVSLAECILNVHPTQYYEPGTASVYSNYTTAIAAYVVECVSGQEFYQYQSANIFSVAGMSQTAGHPYWVDNISVLENKAQGYSAGNQGNFQNSGWSHVGLYPSGAVNGTVGDLARFTIALMPSDGSVSPLFQNPDTLALMLSPSYEEGHSGTAHGFFEFGSATTNAYGHGGNTFAFSSQLVFVPEEQFGIIVLTNMDSEIDILFGLQDLLIGIKPTAQEPTQGMPDAHIFEGSYVSMRRPEKTPMEFVSYMSMANIQAIDANTIKFQMSLFSGTYVQTSPYVFEITEGSDTIFIAMFSRVEFKVENGVPVQIMVGNGMDMSVLPTDRTKISLGTSVILLVFSTLFFIASPIILVVAAGKRKKKAVVLGKKLSFIQMALTLSGTALLANNVLMVISMMTNPGIRYSQILPFVIANYLLSGVGAVAVVFAVVNFKKYNTKAQKTGVAVTSAVLLSFVSLLANWNMFAIYF